MHPDPLGATQTIIRTMHVQVSNDIVMTTDQVVGVIQASHFFLGQMQDAR